VEKGNSIYKGITSTGIATRSTLDPNHWMRNEVCMRIAFTTSEFVTESMTDGGIANYIQRVALTLKQQGHSVEIFVPGNVNETIVHRGIPVHRAKLSKLLYWVSLKITFNRFSSVVYIVVCNWALRREFLKRHRQNPFDIVQASSYLSCGLGLAHLRPIPMVVRISTYEPLWRAASSMPSSSPSYDQLLVEKLERYVVRHATGVYAPSMLLAKVVENETKVPVDVIRPPFMTENESFDDEVYRRHLAGVHYMLYFGRINKIKGILALADALSILLPRYPEMHFAIVGSASANATYLNHMLKRLEVNLHQIHYLGVLPHSELYPIVANARAVVLPSLMDNLPNACLEAMSFGRLVIGTRGTSLDELIDDGISGFLVAPGNVDELAKAMECAWLMSESDRQNMGAKARVKMIDFDPIIACRTLEQWFERHLQ
jgi:glycosyltransferase involved in cell wall biosynthesis